MTRLERRTGATSASALAPARWPEEAPRRAAHWPKVVAVVAVAASALALALWLAPPVASTPPVDMQVTVVPAPPPSSARDGAEADEEGTANGVGTAEETAPDPLVDRATTRPERGSSALASEGSAPVSDAPRPARRPPVRSEADPVRAAPEPAATPEPGVPAEPSPVSPSLEAQGRLQLDTTPYSIVSLGPQRLGITPIDVELPAGSHTLTLRNPEQGIETTYRVTVRAGESTVRRVAIE